MATENLHGNSCKIVHAYADTNRRGVTSVYISTFTLTAQAHDITDAEAVQEMDDKITDMIAELTAARQAIRDAVSATQI